MSGYLCHQCGGLVSPAVSVHYCRTAVATSTLPPLPRVNERARIRVLLDDPDLLESMAHAHYRSQWPAVDDWAEGTEEWRDMHRDDMRAALDVLRARIEEDG